jgi:inositol-hexakisphosphate/diphosphoinositol-pentakisphosphate 1-kinase
MSAPSSPAKLTSSIIMKPRHIIGICALEAKSRSKPMRNILDRLLASNTHPTNPVRFEIILFTDQMILNEPISQWPNCDALIAFYSQGFPLEKAIAYQKERGIFCVNDLVMQYVLQDRRLTQLILEAIDVPTPKRIWLNGQKDSPPTVLSSELNEVVSRDFNVDISSSQYYKRPAGACLTANGIRVGREILARPFIEKPANADDHNIWIYQKDGIVCKLFRKVANKSSERVPEEEVTWRGSLEDSVSLVYEEFLPVDSGEDIKVYTVGPNYAYAESRKSPFVDGIVRRNAQGKEIRTVTQLTEEEQEIARRVCMAFGQTVCGFDMIRSEGKSYVIDINGWSFVKGSDTYYDKAAKILKDTFIQIARRKRRHSVLSGSPGALLQSAPLENDFLIGQWKLKAYVGVFRHADRTPKQKLKVYAKNPKLFEFFLNNRDRGGGEGKQEVTLKSQKELENISKICKEIIEGDFSLTSGVGLLSLSASASNSGSIYSDGEFLASNDSVASSTASFKSLTLAPGVSSLKQILKVLDKKIKVPGTKIQLRQPDLSSPSNLQIILKWGGEFTHAGRHQSKDAGENLRKDLMILNKRILDDVRVFSSIERRVQATAQVFSKAFFPIAELPDNFITDSAELLDDNLVEKKLFDSVKQRIRAKFRNNPLVLGILAALRRHRQILLQNYAKFEEQPKRWCCSESPLLFKERWDKHFTDIFGPEDEDNSSDLVWNVDLSRISDLYDSIRYDAIHHRQFLIQMFVGLEPGTAEYEENDAGDTEINYNDAIYNCNYDSLVKLFDDLHKLFRLITPLEYGFTRGERLKISKQISGKLLEKIVRELGEARDPASTEPFVRLFFTKETHMHALMNLIKYSGIPLSKNNTGTVLNNASASGSKCMTPIIPNLSEYSCVNTDSESESEYELVPDIGPSDTEASKILTVADEVDLDYLSQICFEFYEKVKPAIGGESKNPRSYSLRIGISKGAHDAHLFDLQMDAKHAVTVKGRTWITEYLDGEQVLEWFHGLVN